MGRLAIGKQISEAQQTATINSNNIPTIDPSAYNELTREIIDYYNADQEMKSIKNICEAKKSNIIDSMKNIKLDAISINGIKCTLSERSNKSIDQQKLLEYCKGLNIDGLIKTVEVVDLDMLEDLTYKRQIDPTDIDEFTTKTTSTVLRLSGKPKVLNG